MFWQASLYLAHQAPWFWPLVGALLGGVLGSFFACAAHRLPRGLSLRQPPSHCPKCKTILQPPDLIPIFSYLFLKSRCRHCQAPIPPQTLAIELATTATGAILAYVVVKALLG